MSTEIKKGILNIPKEECKRLRQGGYNDILKKNKKEISYTIDPRQNLMSTVVIKNNSYGVSLNYIK